MNEMKVDEIKRNDEMILLDKYFPGISCGNQNCEKKAVLLCKIFSKMPLMTKEEIQLLLQTNIAKYKNCKDVFCCRFFADKTISCFSDSSEVKFIFHAGNNECKKCASLDKTTVTETELRDSRKMRSKGFFMQKDGIYRPHPNCKCR